nr:hypothetical protein [uncultured bacterium]
MKEFYHNNIKQAQQTLATIEKKININSLLRLAIIIGGGAVLFQIFQINNVWYLLLSILVIVLSFAFLVRRQSKLEKEKEETKAFLRVNQNEVAIEKGESNMYSDGGSFDDGKHPYVSDLDIFGPKSLFSLINRSSTADGEERLATWFLSAASKDVIEARQQAAAELSKKIDWSQKLQTKLLFNLGQKTNIKTFLERYLSDEGLRFGSAFMSIYVKIAPFLFLVGVAVSLFVTPIWNYLLLLAIAHLIWTMSQAGKVGYFSSRIDKIGATLIAYADAVEMIEKEKFEAPLNIQLQENLKTDKQENLSVAFKNLGALVDKLDARNNILVGSFLNILFLWDFKQVMAIVQWKKKL